MAQSEDECAVWPKSRGQKLSLCFFCITQILTADRSETSGSRYSHLFYQRDTFSRAAHSFIFTGGQESMSILCIGVIHGIKLN